MSSFFFTAGNSLIFRMEFLTIQLDLNQINESSIMRIAVTGATGFIGSHLIESLLQKGDHPVCLIRKTSNLQWLPYPEIEFVTGNLQEPESLVDFVKNAEAVIHLAGITKARTEAEYRAGNFAGTINLVRAIQKFNPEIRRFVYASSQAAAGPSPDGVPLKEDDAPHPVSAYGRSKLEAETYLKNTEAFPFTIIRPPAVYGPRDKDVFSAFKLCARGIQPLVGKDKYLSIAFVKNLVKGFLLALEKECARRETYFITDDGILTWKTLTQMIANALGKKPIRIHIPESLLSVPAELSGLIGNILNRPMLFSRDKIMEIRQHFWTVDISKAKVELGYKPDFTTEEGIRETARWYLENGWL